MSNITIENIRLEHAPHLEQLQIDCFPTLAPSELMRREHFENHVHLFPEGNFVAVTDEGRIVGLGSGFLIKFDFEHPDHTFMDIIDGGFYNNHDPEGDYYYGADISVHPDFRRQGIGAMLYKARQGIIRELNLKGLVGGGLIPDFANHKHELTAQEYVDKVVRGELTDNTLSFQLKNGFKVRGLLENYIEDSASDNWSTLIVWDNPDYK